MDVATLLTVTQTVLQLLDSSVMKETGNLCSFRSQLMKTKDTMSTIKAVLVGAEEQEKQQVQRSETDNDWLDKLRDVVYEADDLFDKVATLAQRERHIDGIGGKVFLLLSRPTFIFNASREIKDIRERLNAISKDRRDFGSYSLLNSDVGEGSSRNTVSKESHSYVRDEDVVGRDDDKRALINMLLDPNSNVEENVSCITIVGIGGLGKTTLAQLAYNDDKIQREFTLRLWVCVSQKFDVYKILCRMLELLTDKSYECFGMEKVQIKLQQEIRRKRYLLILDDVWNENREEWLRLTSMLIVGGKGSRILVTTRSHLVARVIGDFPTYELEGLSFKDSWTLFEKKAFKGKGQADVELVEIGKEIVRRCANIPLAIKIIASLVYGQGKSKWRSFRDIDLIHLKQDGVLPVLKLSYYHLDPPLKSCFNYCALFPTDYVIEKKTLIRLWIAQGFIVPSLGQSVEETGEEYFMTLLHRGFLQDVRQGNLGELVSCEIPAVMHNLAQEAAKLEILVANSDTSQFNGKLRHLSVGELNTYPTQDSSVEDFAIEELLTQAITSCSVKSMRTFFNLYPDMGGLKASSVRKLISRVRSFRVLSLQYACFRRLPTLNNLLHLRYLDLSHNEYLLELPNSLENLHNLQTLKLDHCQRLKELPRGLRKLVNLKYLEISGCDSLTHMPQGISCLTSLQSLTMFVVGKTDLFKQVRVSELKDLKALINIKGSLTIMVRKVVSTDTMYIVGGGRYLTSMEHLSDICLDWRNDEDVAAADHETLLKGLEPHYNLKMFHLKGYPGMKFPIPSWKSISPPSC